MTSRRLKNSRTRKLRFEQLCRRELMAGDMTNPANSLDVNNDSNVSAGDALAIINYMAMMNNVGEGEQAGSSRAVFPDTNGDSKVTASDALRVINNLVEAEQVPPPAPDLVIRSASTGSVSAQTVQVNVQIGNDGTQLATGSTVQVTVDLLNSNGSVAATATGAIPLSGATSNGSISVPIGNLNPGTFPVRVTIDGADNVNETSEANNTFQLAAPISIANNNAGGQVFGLIVDTGNSPRIKFSAVNITVNVTSPAAGRLAFTMNGNTQTLSIKDGFRVQVIGNNNKLIFNGAIIPDDLNIEIVDGTNNVIQLINTRVGDDFIYRGNGGRDNIILDNGTVIGDRADIKTKGGNDTIAIRGARIGDDFILHTGDGNDLLAVNGVFVGDDAIVRMEDHNDTVSLANARVGDKADIRGNSGLDTLAVDAATVAAGKREIKDFEAQGALANVNQVIANLLS